MCFVDLEKAFDRVPRGILWGVLREYGVQGPLLRRLFGLCTTGAGAWFALPAARTFSVYWRRFAAKCEAAGMRISTSKSEAMVLDRKRKLEVEEFKYLRVLFMSEGKMEHEIDRQIGAASTVMWLVYRTLVVVKKSKDEALDLPVNLCSHSHLWS
ncbi:hypothetical protein L3Q82_007190 [Scortum barcoo]|uniref:Uncharacterized protein n=1 Tax=Scortum barcoo TaxID=214431 RepID=A0ACB8WSP8_9TELE|nr:hypothetical protein L3Q82_007190 [Scortum barcoo]